jgi:hypothetical protein
MAHDRRFDNRPVSRLSAALAAKDPVVRPRRAETAVGEAKLAWAALRTVLFYDDGEAVGPAVGLHRVVMIKNLIEPILPVVLDLSRLRRYARRDGEQKRQRNDPDTIPS